jgi:hypothetical protein
MNNAHCNIIAQTVTTFSKNQKMIEELKTIWNRDTNIIFADGIVEIMRKYFGKR